MNLIHLISSTDLRHLVLDSLLMIMLLIIADLDISNCRYGRTPEYPNGTYAYFVGITSISLQPKFPYFIGNTYRSNPVIDNYKLTQKDFNIEDSNLIRNTYPYKVSDQFADNDFIVESNEISKQVSG